MIYRLVFDYRFQWSRCLKEDDCDKKQLTYLIKQSGIEEKILQAHVDILSCPFFPVDVSKIILYYLPWANLKNRNQVVIDYLILK
jgi:hypothetical protein